MASVAATMDSAADVAGADASPSFGQFVGFLLMVLGMFMAILDIQIVSASLGQIQAGLAASADEISWVQTSYLVAEVVMIPLSGFLGRALSTKWLFVGSATGFTIASFLCSTATSIEQMIVYRALQGFLGGAMIPTVYAASFLIFGRQRQTGVAVSVSLIVTLAPTLGPSIGGWISDALSWQWLFLINLLPGILIIFGVWALVDIDKPDTALLRRIDLLGLLCMALFLGGLDYVLEEGARHDWFADKAVFWVAIIASISAIGFFWRAATAKEPIVNLRPFANFNFLSGSSLGALLGVALYGLVYLYPLYLARVAGLSSGQIGNTVFVTGLTMLATAPIAGMIARKTDPRGVLIAGFLLMALSTWMTHNITADWRFDQLLWPQIVRGMGLMSCMVTISMTSFATLPVERLKDASGLFTLMRNLGGAMGLAMINTVVLWRFNLHWGRLAESINPGRPEVAERIDLLTGLASNRGLANPEMVAVRQLGNQVYQQALVMSYADCFTLLSLAFVSVALLPLLLKRPQLLRNDP